MTSNTSNSNPVLITEKPRLFTGAQFLCHALASEGVTHIFGGHGGAVVPLVDAIVAHPSLTWVYCRCEVNASQMAAAHAKLNGTLGCCVATSGPGAAHLLSGLVDAEQDRVPLLCITGLKDIGHARYSDFQDIDQSSIFRMAGLALSETVSDIHQLLPLTRNAFTVAIASNRCAHLAVPVNVQQDEIEAREHFCLGTAFQERANFPATNLQVEALVMALRSEIDSNRRVLISCGYRAAAIGKYIERIAELLHAPILTSYDGKGTVNEHHPLSFGVVGVYGNTGTPAAVDLLERCETVIGICVNDWTELVTNKTGLQMRRMIQIDERLVAGDSMRFSPSAVFSCGFLGESLQRVIKVLEKEIPAGHRLAAPDDIISGKTVTVHEPTCGEDVWTEIKKETFVKPTGCPSTFLKGKCINPAEITSKEHCHPAVFFDVMGNHLDSSSVICADIGDNSLFMAGSLAAKRGQRFLTSEHLGIMGYGFNSGLAASLSAIHKGNGRKTMIVAGDGGIQMSLNELATMQDHGAKNVLVVVVVNSRLGRVQNERWGPKLLADGCHIGSPDYLKLFEAYGYPGGMVLSTCEREVVAAKIEKGWQLAAQNGCCVIEVRQDPNVHPIMHKLQPRLSHTPWSDIGGDSSSIRIQGPEHIPRVEQWLNNLTSVEMSDPFWLDKGDIFTVSPSAVVQTLSESLSIAPDDPPQLFRTTDAKAIFDSQFHAAFLNAMPAKVLVQEVSEGTANRHPLKVQFLACPANFNFKLHSHPNAELIIPFVGELWERRLVGARLAPSILTRQESLSVSEDADAMYRAPSDEEMIQVKQSLQSALSKSTGSLRNYGMFADRSNSEGQVLYNEAGSIHQSYTKDKGCLLLVLWSGLHADIENCDCGIGHDGSEF